MANEPATAPALPVSRKVALLTVVALIASEKVALIVAPSATAAASVSGEVLCTVGADWSAWSVVSKDHVCSPSALPEGSTMPSPSVTV